MLQEVEKDSGRDEHEELPRHEHVAKRAARTPFASQHEEHRADEPDQRSRGGNDEEGRPGGGREGGARDRPRADKDRQRNRQAETGEGSNEDGQHSLEGGARAPKAPGEAPRANSTLASTLRRATAKAAAPPITATATSAPAAVSKSAGPRSVDTRSFDAEIAIGRSDEYATSGGGKGGQPGQRSSRVASPSACPWNAESRPASASASSSVSFVEESGHSQRS